MNELRIKQVNELEQFIDNAIFVGDEPCDIAEMVKVVTDKQNKNITKELEETKAKLHSLQIEILGMSCAKENNSGFEPSLSVYQRSVDMVIAAARKAPVKHLADIKADAVESLTEQDYGYSVEIGGHTDEWVISVDQIKEYADKLRGES